MSKTLEEYKIDEERRKQINKTYYETKTKIKRQEISKVKKEEKAMKKHLNDSYKDLLKGLNNKQLKSVNTYISFLTNSHKLNTTSDENSKTKEELFNDYIELLNDNINNDKLPSIYKLNIEDKNINKYTSDDLINVMYTIKNILN